MTAAGFARATVSARAAVAGNPSDGYGGAVVSLPVPHLSATATIVSDPAAPTMHQRESTDITVLVHAAQARFEGEVLKRLGGTRERVAVSVSTSIPRSVGLAGSSAIVISTLNALALHYGAHLAPMAVARLAHNVERVDLGIAGGWQDEIVQSHGAPLLMEFSEPMSQRLLPWTSIPLWVAWRSDAAESSGTSHGALRERAVHESRRDAPHIAAVMAELAALARIAALALEDNDAHTVKECMNATFDLRCRVMPIADRHQHMIDTARAAGAAANFTGSGGAIIGVVPKDPNRLFSSLTAAGMQHVAWTPAEGPANGERSHG